MLFFRDLAFWDSCQLWDKILTGVLFMESGQSVCKKRNVAVDVMRGMSLVGMSLMNLNPSETFSFPTFLHSEWSGLTLADIFFPCFLFIAGVSVAINADRKIFGEHWFRDAWKRFLLLFGAGILYNHLGAIWSLFVVPEYTLHEFFLGVTTYFRPFGVLQRIGFAYFFGVVIFHWLKTERKNLMAAGMVLFLTTAGFYLYSFSEPFSQTNNISMMADQLLQGSDHNYCQKDFDPEGMYGNITAIASMLLGMVAGMWLKKERRLLLVYGGCACFLLGLLASIFVIISKPLWTASYVLILSGVFMVVLSVLDKLLAGCSSVPAYLKLFVILGAHSMMTYFVGGNVEVVINTVQIGDITFYQSMLENVFFSEQHPSLSCLLCSLWPFAVICVFVCVYDYFCKSREKQGLRNA